MASNVNSSIAVGYMYIQKVPTIVALASMSFQKRSKGFGIMKCVHPRLQFCIPVSYPSVKSAYSLQESGDNGCQDAAESSEQRCEGDQETANEATESDDEGWELSGEEWLKGDVDGS